MTANALPPCRVCDQPAWWVIVDLEEIPGVGPERAWAVYLTTYRCDDHWRPIVRYYADGATQDDDRRERAH